jgi:hypothetical protein
MTNRRKKTSPPRAMRFHLLLSAEERAQLDAASEDMGITRADVLRLSFSHYPKIPRAEAQKAACELYVKARKESAR